MAHFAELNESNEVVNVIVVSNDVITIDSKESEQAGIDFLTEIYGHNRWVQTSYNKNIRKNFAGIGYFYDGIAFYMPQPYPSWILNKETYGWEAPVPRPTESAFWIWNEEKQEWKWNRN
jgi:hypothetical protein